VTADNAEPSVADLVADLERLTAEAADLADQEHSTALVHVTSDPAVVKARMAEVHSLVRRKQSEVAAAQQALRARLDAEMARANQVLEPLKKMVARMQEGIWTINLYLGRDESIVRLTEGDPAPADTPITIRQMTLAMDEESRIAAEVGGIDINDLPEFDAWLAADPAHVEQIIPEPKGVVVLVASRQNRDYGNPWTTLAMKDANTDSYWLIRNGDNLYRMHTDLRVGHRLVPLADEFTSLFRRRAWSHERAEHGDWVDLKPGSREWAEAEEKADSKHRHYMRAALVIQGLIDRTTVFHPLPHPGLSVLQPDDYDAGHVAIITDAERAIGTGRPPFSQWLKDLNAGLRPGMRVVVAFNSTDFRSENHVDRDGYGGRVFPSDARGLPEMTPVVIDGTRRHQGAEYLTVKFDRTDKRWGWEHPSEPAGWRGAWGEWPYKHRATVLIHPADPFVIAFDLVNPDDLDFYLNARTERHNYLTVLPLIRATLEAKRREHEAEAPVRAMLAGVIARDCSVSVPDAEAKVGELVDWWKLGNRWHRPLVLDGDIDDRVAAAVVAEYRRRVTNDERGDTEADKEAAKVAEFQAAVPDLLAVARKPNGTYVAYSAADDGNVWVHRWRPTRTGVAVDTEWAVTGTGWRRWRLLWHSDRWTGWDHDAHPSDHLRPHEIVEVATRVVVVAARYAADRSWSYSNGWGSTIDADPRFYGVIFRKDNEHKRGLFYAHLWFPPLLPPPDRPATGKIEAPVKTCVEYEWKRTRDGITLSRFNTWGVPQYSRDDFIAKAAWLDRAELDALDAATAEYNTARDRATAIGRRAGAAFDALRDTLRAEWETAQYQRFIDDYADPDLWEGHLKTLRYDDDLDRASVTFVLKRAIESGWVDANPDATFADLASTATALNDGVQDEWGDLVGLLDHDFVEEHGHRPLNIPPPDNDDCDDDDRRTA